MFNVRLSEPGVLGCPRRLEGLGPVELDAGADLLDPGSVQALHNLLLHTSGLGQDLGWGLLSGLALGSDLLRRGLGTLGSLGSCRRLIGSFLGCHSSESILMIRDNRQPKK